MATLLAHITVKAGEEHRFESLVRGLYETTHATEPGVLRYEYWRGAEAGTYYSLLSYTDFDSFITHQTSAHHEGAAPQLRELVESIRLEWVDPVTGAGPLPTTDGTSYSSSSSSGTVDDLTITYRRRFAVQVAEWWLALR